MNRKLFAVASLCMASGLVGAPVVSAAAPDHQPAQMSGTVVVTDLCDFPVTVDYQQNLDFTLRYDGAGNFIGFEAVAHEQDTLTGTSSLVSEPFTFHVSYKLDRNGDLVMLTYAGAFEKVRLPGGEFVIAGWASFPNDDFIVFSDRGNPGNVAALCAALEG